MGEEAQRVLDSVEKQKLFLPKRLLLQFRNILGLSDKAGLNFRSALAYGEGKLTGPSNKLGEEDIREMREAIHEAITAIQHRYGING